MSDNTWRKDPPTADGVYWLRAPNGYTETMLASGGGYWLYEEDKPHNRESVMALGYTFSHEAVMPPATDDPATDRKAVADQMVKRGGGFAASLGYALMRADDANARAIYRAMPDLIAHYRAWVAKGCGQ